MVCACICQEQVEELLMCIFLAYRCYTDNLYSCVYGSLDPDEVDVICHWIVVATVFAHGFVTLIRLLQLTDEIVSYGSSSLSSTRIVLFLNIYIYKHIYTIF